MCSPVSLGNVSSHRVEKEVMGGSELVAKGRRWKGRGRHTLIDPSM
jgi:hypothetical protein